MRSKAREALHTAVFFVHLSLLPLGPKYLSQHPVFGHPQPIIFHTKPEAELYFCIFYSLYFWKAKRNIELAVPDGSSSNISVTTSIY